MYPEGIGAPIANTENTPAIGELIMKACQAACGIECDLACINSRITGPSANDSAKRGEPTCLRDEAFALLDILESIAKLTNDIGRALYR